MKLTRRQLNRIITESLGVQPVSEIKGVPKILNYGKMRKDLFALKNDIDNQALLDKVGDHIDDLQTKVDAGEGKFLKGRYREAVTLLQSMKAVMDAPTPEKVEKVIDKVPDVQPAKDKDPDPDSWNPDPDPNVGWEYQNRDCIWYTRKKGTEKEFKLGHASGKPLEKGGKFLGSIVKLNKAYPDLVKNCDPLLKKPTPKPGKKDPTPESKGSSPEFIIVDGFNDFGDKLRMRAGKGNLPSVDTKTFSITTLNKVANQAAAKDAVKESKAGNIGMADVKDALVEVAEGQGFKVIMTAYSSTGGKPADAAAGGTFEVFIAYTTKDIPNTVVIEMTGKFTTTSGGEDSYVAPDDENKQPAKPLAEGLSRGSLYRRRYYGRY